MDLKPHYDNFTRPVLFFLGIIVLLCAFAVNTIAVVREYWLSETLLIAVLLTIVAYWHLRLKIWFWGTVAAISVLQGGLTFLFPAPLIIPGSPLLFLLVFFDLFLLVACIKFIGRKVSE